MHSSEESVLHRVFADNVTACHPRMQRAGEPLTALRDDYDLKLLQWLQDDFPLIARPWTDAALHLGISEEEALLRTRNLTETGIVRTLHVIVNGRNHRSGGSSLVAMRVPDERIRDVASIVNEYPCVTHNYRRDHEYNLWFTVNTENARELEGTIGEIRRRTGVGDRDILDLRTNRVFKVDVRFGFNGNRPRSHINARRLTTGPVETDSTDRALLRMTQAGIPLEAEPFRAIAGRLGIPEADVISRLSRQLDAGTIKRIGISVNQRALGIVANAVVVWNVPRDRVDEAGWILSAERDVTHCYERQTVPGRWEYNLFAVLHGYDRESVLDRVNRLSDAIGFADHRVLFSTEQFKRTSIIHDLPRTAGSINRSVPGNGTGKVQREGRFP